MKKVYLLAVIAALLTGYATFRFATSIESQAKNQVEGSVSVAVAATKIDSNTIITDDMVEIKQFAKDLVSKDIAKSKKEVVGKIVQYPISAGEPIYSSRISAVGGNGNNDTHLAYDIPTGMEAVTISVDPITGIGNFIKQGDRVDVIAYFTSEEKGAKRRAFENLLVLRTGNETAPDDKKATDAKTYTSVTLAVTPDQAVELNYTIINAVVRLALRSPAQ